MVIEQFRPTKKTTAYRINVLRGKTPVATSARHYTTEPGARKAIKAFNSMAATVSEKNVRAVKTKAGWIAVILSGNHRPFFQLKKVFRTEAAAVKAGIAFCSKYH